MPVFTPGSINRGLVLKYFSQTSRRVESSGGTTEEITMPVNGPTSSPAPAKRLRNNTPYSSTVWVRMVDTRQCASSRGSGDDSGELKTPRTVLVLPTSTTRSIEPQVHHRGTEDSKIPKTRPNDLENCEPAIVTGAPRDKSLLMNPRDVAWAAIALDGSASAGISHRRNAAGDLPAHQNPASDKHESTLS